jgi:hypothetical protein
MKKQTEGDVSPLPELPVPIKMVAGIQALETAKVLDRQGALKLIDIACEEMGSFTTGAEVRQAAAEGRVLDPFRRYQEPGFIPHQDQVESTFEGWSAALELRDLYLKSNISRFPLKDDPRKNGPRADLMMAYITPAISMDAGAGEEIENFLFELDLLPKIPVTGLAPVDEMLDPGLVAWGDSAAQLDKPDWMTTNVNGPDTAPVIKALANIDGEGDGSGIHIGGGFILTARHNVKQQGVEARFQYTGDLQLDTAEERRLRYMPAPGEYVDNVEYDAYGEVNDWALLQDSSLADDPTPSFRAASSLQPGERLWVVGNHRQGSRQVITGIFDSVSDEGNNGLILDMVGPGGDSGSPVLDGQGKVVGILYARETRWGMDAHFVTIESIAQDLKDEAVPAGINVPHKLFVDLGLEEVVTGEGTPSADEAPAGATVGIDSPISLAVVGGNSAGNFTRFGNSTGYQPGWSIPPFTNSDPAGDGGGENQGGQ